MMNPRFIACLSGATALLLSASMASDLGELGELAEVRRAHDAGEIVSLEKILATVDASFTGLVVEVELEREKGRLEYEVELLTGEGHVLELTYDATTGKLLDIDGTGIEAARKKP